MGRRKLPSLPPQRTEKASEGLPPPIYLTSSAPLYSAESERSTAAQEQSAFTRTKVRTSSYSDLTRPSSASSVLSNADYHSTIDPTIIPGATIAGVKPKTRQTSSAVTGGKSAALLAQTNKYKMPTTLARVLLKKELKEALEKRRESLEACEIEANQRQYVVRRMLLTGLLPESRPAEIDDIPNVIPCLLPIELISGANVIPTTSASTTTARKFTEQKCCYTQSLPSTSKTQSIAISTEDVTPSPLRAKSVGVQAGDVDLSSGLSSPASVQTFSVIQKDRGYRRLNSSLITSVAPKYMSTETQTEHSSLSDRRRSKIGTSSSAKRKSTKKISSSDTNLLETTAKYFAEYDRQLREHGRLMRHHFTFADDDPVKRETKKQRLIDELARRKEKISSMIDLNTATDYPTDYGASDYSSTVPHYGSLPRLDYTSSVRPSRYREDYGFYNSLPRNYERYRDMYDYNQPDYDLLQPQTLAGIRSDPLTRSLNDLRLDTEDSIIDPRVRTSAAHSLDYYGRSNYPYRDTNRSAFAMRRPYPYGRRYAADDLNPQRLQYSDLDSSGKPDMISQYANFLSNQFRTDQEEQLSREHKIGAGFSNISSSRLPTRSQYSGPMSDPYPTYRGSYSQQRYQPYGTSNYNATSYDPLYSEPASNPVAYPQRIPERNIPYTNLYNTRYDGDRLNSAHPSLYEGQEYTGEMQLNTFPNSSDYRSEPFYPRELSQVYSRNETNYGSRQPQTATDYGNFYRNRQPPPSLPYDSYDSYVNERYPGYGLQDSYHTTYNLAGPPYTSTPAYPQNRQNLSVGGTTGFSNPSRQGRNEPSSYSVPLNTYGTQQNNNVSRYGRIWPQSSTTYYDESYPHEDALTRVYASASDPYRSPRSQRLGNAASTSYSCI
ncbi:unnamed protein product [Enterobius vermicularis]|uniref:CUPID domain-containing protein n=1 Tax=Enterobius vermicularis TaxID=51028 RepID=A0A0N4VHM9_ENTVE|nr:unnamed protein product [Enterobius vermicularis]